MSTSTPPVLVLQKRAAWSRLYNFDFSNFGEFNETPAQTISAATITATSLTVGTPALSNSAVQAQISGGTSNTVYPINVLITTSGGATLSMNVKLEVN